MIARTTLVVRSLFALAGTALPLAGQARATGLSWLNSAGGGGPLVQSCGDVFGIVAERDGADESDANVPGGDGYRDIQRPRGDIAGAGGARSRGTTRR